MAGCRDELLGGFGESRGLPVGYLVGCEGIAVIEEVGFLLGLSPPTSSHLYSYPRETAHDHCCLRKD